MYRKLFIPGPIDVAEDVLQQLAKPMIGHRSKEASALQRRISDKVRTCFYTKNEILLSTSSGSGLMEGTIRSCTAKRAAVFSVGAFGDRWYKMAVANGVPADKFTSVPGQPTTAAMVDEALKTGKYDLVTVTHNETSTGITNPVDEIADVVRRYPDVVWAVDAVSSAFGSKIEVDRLGIDVCITSTQKALGLPPGMAICSISEKAYQRTKQVPCRGLYFDLQELYDFIKKNDYQYPSTPCLSLMYAMDYQLDKILVSGIEARFAYHQKMAEVVRSWARKHFEIFTNENNLSNTLTVIKNTRGFSVADLNKKLAERGEEISNGYGELKEKTFRIAHMGDQPMSNLTTLLSDIEQIVGL